MDQSEEQLDYEDEDRRLQEGEETIPEEEDYEDLYHDVNVGFISLPDPDLELDLNPSSAPENRTAIAESPPPDSPKDYGEANEGRQSFGAITQKPGRESNTGPAGTLTSAATSTPSRRGNCDYAGRDSGEKDGGGVLFVGELNWWTTDADLEASLSEYGRVKSIVFSEEKASGKCRGSCEVQFYEYACARACKEGMDGRVFNGRPCVVSLANSRTLRQIGDGMGYKGKVGNHQDSQSRRMMNDSGGGGGGGRAGTGGGGGRAGTGGGGKASTGGGRLSGGGEGGRGRYYGRSNRGPSGYGGQGRGQGGQGRGRPVKGMGGGQVSANGGGQYGQVYLGSIGGGTMPPPMRNQGFDLAFGGQMGRGAGGGGVGYVGFAAHSSSHYPAMVHPFSPVGSVSLSGVAPHVNPAFIGQGMIGNGMGMVTSGSGMEGHHAGMWTDSSWGGDVHSRRMGESGYGEDIGSEYGYAEKNHDRGGRSNAQWNRDRSTENDRMGASGKRHRNDRETDWNGGRDRYREKERDGHQGQRERGRNWESERASRARGRSHAMEEADQDDFSREPEYPKRRY